MGEIVYLKRNIAYTDSMVIANETGIQHESVMRLIKKHAQRLGKYECRKNQ